MEAFSVWLWYMCALAKKLIWNFIIFDTRSRKLAPFSEIIELSWQRKHPTPQPPPPNMFISLSFPSDQLKDAQEPPFLDLNNVPKAH